MRPLRPVLTFMIAASLFGCASEKDPAMPDVVGTKLDVAKSDIERAGFEDEVDILGGGLFGIINEANWEVCEQTPAAGKPLTKPPRLKVERDCNKDEVLPSDEPTPELEVTEAPAEPEKTPAATTAAGPSLADLEAYIADNFGSATWFPSITGYKALGGGELEVTTSLDPAAAASSEDAQAVCAATTDFFLVQEKEPLVRVTASDGEILARRTALNDRCAP